MFPCSLWVANWCWPDIIQHSAQLSGVFTAFASAAWCINHIMMFQRLLPHLITVLCHILYLHSVFLIAMKHGKVIFVPHLDLTPPTWEVSPSLSTNAVNVDPLSIPLTMKNRVETFSLDCGGGINWTSHSHILLRNVQIEFIFVEV